MTERWRQAFTSVHFASGGSEVALASIDSVDEGWVTATAVLLLFDFFVLLAMLAGNPLCSGAGAHWYSGYDVHRCS